VCPVGAIKQNGFAAPVIDQEKCIQCEECVMFCPMKAIGAK
jgi:ferredoxin